MDRTKLFLAAVCCLIGILSTAASGQGRRTLPQRGRGIGPGSLGTGMRLSDPQDFFRDAHRGRSMRELSWIYVEPPKPREVKFHDIVTIIVDEKSEVTLNSKYNRTRNATLKMELKEFMRLTERGTLGNAAANQPTIDTNMQSRLQSTGQATDQEGIRYRIAATVVDVRPNGVLVLEARKSISTNDDMWEYTLSGKLRIEDITKNNDALSEDIADLRIVKKQNGKIFDSTKRGWAIRLYDMLSPF